LQSWGFQTVERENNNNNNKKSLGIIGSL